jgi:symplekin
VGRQPKTPFVASIVYVLDTLSTLFLVCLIKLTALYRVVNFLLCTGNLPPTLGSSQVTSVRKMMKVHMMSLLKLPYASGHLSGIMGLLTELGASYSEVGSSRSNHMFFKEMRRFSQHF